MKDVSERSQIAVVWWGIAFTVIYGFSLGFLLHMVPPPTATLDTAGIAAFYAEHHDSIRIGAVVASWSSAFMLPFAAVLTIQMLRHGASKLWAILTVMGGSMMSIFLVLPPLFWGVAAFTEGRDENATALMHELGTLTLVTTDQFYIFMWVALIVVSFKATSVSHSPFPRWYGYFTIWTATMFEAGAFAFLPRTGPFAWNGALVFWNPLALFGLWIAVTSFVLLRSLRAQREAREAAGG